MRRLRYRAAALDDLDSIFDFIARDHPARAIVFTDALRRRCRKLASTASPSDPPGKMALLRSAT